ncbi:TetR family transcriptional regulator [Undibacterium sp. YM2]|uniref:TetR/AcrR family transcriptional regulator n=1 Tax=Undibacterium sp. YM2 TaxID=2058625 RepID=UPI001331D80E|nr:TetR/AcrR family transcriptional regulator [Undibacterium sp. YM2]BBB67289.1 TetR family transcriptional regulator [Undibacterium sp. YM2]
MKHFSEISPMAERIIDVAQGLIQQQGYNGFSYDDIAKLVGIKKPSIHHHFPRKEDLVSVLVQRYTHVFRGELLGIEGRHASPVERLRAYAAVFEQTFNRDKRLCVCGMLGAESGSLPESAADEVARFFKVNLDWLAQIIGDAQHAGLVTKNCAADSLAQTYLSALEGAMVLGRGMRTTQGPAEIAQTFLSTVSV